MVMRDINGDADESVNSKASRSVWRVRHYRANIELVFVVNVISFAHILTKATERICPDDSKRNSNKAKIVIVGGWFLAFLWVVIMTDRGIIGVGGVSEEYYREICFIRLAFLERPAGAWGRWRHFIKQKIIPHHVRLNKCAFSLWNSQHSFNKAVADAHISSAFYVTSIAWNDHN